MTKTKLMKLICSQEEVIYDAGRFDIKLIIDKSFISNSIQVYVIDRDTNEELLVDELYITGDSDEEFCYNAASKIISNESQYIKQGNDYFIQ